MKIYGHEPGHASCMNGGATCNNSTPRPHLGHFPSAVWQGTTTERTAVLRCGGISGSCAVDITPPLFAASPAIPSLSRPLNRLSPSLQSDTHTYIHLHSTSLSLLPFTFLLFAMSTPPTATLIRERARAERAKSSDISAAHIALDGTQYVRRERQ